MKRLFALAVVWIGSLAGAPLAAAPVDFNRDIRPLFSDTCFKCHGFDKNTRKGELRLDTLEGALAKREGGAAIAPGDPKKSLVIERITSTDPDLRMPPAKSGLTLAPDQIELIRRWIAEGAKYSQHWSFIPPQQASLPQVKNANWVRNPIDRFILARLEQEGLSPSPPAEKAALLRRVTLDLTGLPPTLAELDAFLADASPEAYEKVVDRLLRSPRYGERMALEWLDAARFADTHGYHIDSGRDMTAWRDQVIQAFNRNQPFNQFTIEQLAGDLLPNATAEQKVASGFHRNNMINFEGGAIPEEYHTQYIVDRVNTTGTVFLGLTVGCAQCHDHKYDPISQKEYYQLFSFFYNVPENGLDGSKGNATPVMKIASPLAAERTANAKKEIERLEKELSARPAATTKEFSAWAVSEALKRPASAGGSYVPPGFAAHFPLNEKSGSDVRIAAAQRHSGKVQGKADWQAGPDRASLQLDGHSFVDAGKILPLERTEAFSYGGWVFPVSGEHGAVLARMDDAQKYRGYDLYLGNAQAYCHLIHEWESNAIRVNTKEPLELNKWQHVLVTYDGSSKAAGVKIYVNGRPRELQVTHDSLSGSIRTEKPLHLGSRNPGARFKGKLADLYVYERALSQAEVAALALADPLPGLLAIPAEKRTAEQTAALQQHFLRTADKPYQELSAALEKARKAAAESESGEATVMVMQEMPQPRDAFILVRGQYDKKGDKVSAGVPASLGKLPSGASANRLGLAQWLVGAEHPLMARVTVNRFWQMYFGTGIVKTAEDFGSQGAAPSHPELLDWLAVEFRATTWDVKRMQKLIVMSAAYQQSSRVSKELLAKDPENRLLARGPRLRLKAEFIRDQALAVSGLLDGRIGGKSVSPYQPPGIWEELAYRADFKNWTAQVYQQSHGPDLYRRTMYTFWKRTAPPAQLVTFDAPDRETCVVRRATTNTPLQALVLMNDPTYVESARMLAERMFAEGGKTPAERIAWAFRVVLARSPKPKEQTVLEEFYARELARLATDEPAARKLLSVGEAKRNEQIPLAEHAALSLVATTLLNLDETVTK